MGFIKRFRCGDLHPSSRSSSIAPRVFLIIMLHKHLIFFEPNQKKIIYQINSKINYFFYGYPTMTTFKNLTNFLTTIMTVSALAFRRSNTCCFGLCCIQRPWMRPQYVSDLRIRLQLCYVWKGRHLYGKGWCTSGVSMTWAVKSVADQVVYGDSRPCAPPTTKPWGKRGV